MKQPDASTIELAPSRAKFWELNITKVDDITKIVDEVISWTKQNGAPLGGVINCAGVGTAAKVGRMPSSENLLRVLIGQIDRRCRWTTSYSGHLELYDRRQSDGDVQPHANCLQASGQNSARRP